MRTLKKVLALSLVFAMAFTLMAGAAYKDEDSIDSSLRDDITLMEALGVFQGDENGNFNPTNNVTRAEAAKMIYVLKNNGVDDGATAFQGVSKYSDVTTGFWAEGYINYCTNLGYMSGWSENGVQKFDPNGNVTGVELAKMLLCMIGYRADIQGYTNNNAWQTNVQQDAAEAGILTNFTPSLYTPVARQWTARLLVNAINATYVTYTKGELVYGMTTNGVEISYASKFLKLETVEGYLGDAGKVSLNLKNGTTSLDDDGDTIAIYTNKNLDEGRIDTFKTTVDPSLLGQHVKVYFRQGGTTTEEKVYAVIPTDESVVYNVTVGDVTVDNESNGQSIKFEGYNSGKAKTYKDGEIIKFVTNLDDVSDLTADKANGTPATNLKALSGNSNSTIRFVDQDDDGKIDVAFTDVTTYAIVDSHDADKFTIKFEDADGNSLKVIDNKVIKDEDDYEKINFVDTVEADDVVAVTLDCTSGNEVWNVALADVIDSTISGYTLDGSNYKTVTLDGTETKFAKNMIAGYDNSTSGSVGSDTAFYTDGKYIVYSKGGDNATSVNNLAYITKVRTVTSWGDIRWDVQAILTDGTTGTWTVSNLYETQGNKSVKVEDINDSSSAGYNTAKSLLKEGNVLSYSISGDNITLKDLVAKGDTQFATGNQSFDGDNKQVTVNSTDKYRTNDDTYFFVKSKASGDAKYSVVKASEQKKDLNSNAGVTSDFGYKTSNGINTLLFGVIETDGSVISTAADYAFVKTNASIAKDGDNYVVSTTVVLPDGSETEISAKFEDSGSADTSAAAWSELRGNVVKYELDTDGLVDDGELEQVTIKDAVINATTADNWFKVVITGWGNGGAVVYTDVTSDSEEKADLNVASDVKIHVVNTTDEKYAVMSDGKVDLTASKDADDSDIDLKDRMPSALIYVQEIDGELTITDIFTAEDGLDASKLWTAVK